MNQELHKFVTLFRELEQKQFSHTVEEERQFASLKQKLISPPQTNIASGLVRRAIAVASLYPQAGASFIASNLAFYHACNQVNTTLCELPVMSPYLYFALDCERRGRVYKSEVVVSLQQGLLRIKPAPPINSHPDITQIELTSWFLHNHKECSLFIIDLSHHWNSESAIWISEWVDEIWFVLDDNIPRIASLVLSEEAPQIWREHGEKIRFVANKWNGRLQKSDVIRKVEGTLSLWEANINHIKIDGIVPAIDAGKVSKAQLEGMILLERFPEEGMAFEELGKVICDGGGL